MLFSKNEGFFTCAWSCTASVAPKYTILCTFHPIYILWFHSEGFVDTVFTAQFLLHFMPKNGEKLVFLSMLTVFSDLWDDEKTYAQFLLYETIVLLCEHNAKRILNLALSNIPKNHT